MSPRHRDPVTEPVEGDILRTEDAAYEVVTVFGDAVAFRRIGSKRSHVLSRVAFQAYFEVG